MYISYWGVYTQSKVAWPFLILFISNLYYLRAGDLDDAAADAYKPEDTDEDEPEPEDQVDLVDDDVQRQDAHGVQLC